MEKEVQGAETPVTEPAQGAPQPVTATKETVTPPKTETTPKPDGISQADWQTTQETLRALQQRDEERTRAEFERNNPIVLKDGYKEKWAELLKAKNTPGHKYANLDHEDLLHKLHGEVVVNAPVPEPRTIPTVTVPSINPSVSPDLPSGSMSQEARNFMSLRYSDDEIKSVERSA